MFLLRKFQSKSWMNSENFIILQIHNFSYNKINFSSHPVRPFRRFFYFPIKNPHFHEDL